MTTCPITVSDYVVSNCTCHPSYTYSSNFKETYNCVDQKGLKQIVSLLEMSILVFNLVYVIVVVSCYLKARDALKDWVKVELCCRSDMGDTTTGHARQMSVFILSSLLALLALVEKTVVYTDSVKNPAVGLLITIGFLIQVGLEWRYLNLLQMARDTKGQRMRGEVSLGWIKTLIVVSSGLVTTTLIALQFADLRFESAERWIDAYVVYGTIGGLAILLSFVLILFVNELFVKITSMESDTTSTDRGKYDKPKKLLVNNMVFLGLRIVVLALLVVLLGVGPSQNHATLLPAHFAWFVSTLIFVHLLQARSLEDILSRE